MAKLNIANLKKTLYYLQRNGLRETWISVRERLTETDRYFYVPCPEEELERQSCRKWDNPVTLSIVVPLYRTPEIYLNRMITSVMQQSYPHWELILADATEDHSVEETLTNQGFLTERLPENAETIAADARIHYIHLSLIHISEPTIYTLRKMQELRRIPIRHYPMQGENISACWIMMMY